MFDYRDMSCVFGSDSEFGLSAVSMFVTLFPNVVSKPFLHLLDEKQTTPTKNFPRKDIMSRE